MLDSKGLELRRHGDNSSGWRLAPGVRAARQGARGMATHRTRRRRSSPIG